MWNAKYVKSVLTVLVTALLLTGSNFYTDKVTAEPASTATQTAEVSTGKMRLISPLEIVKNPGTYLGSPIAMNAKFDKFSTLGLDYKSAFKSSEEYISFLIKRDDTTYDIPLSEMKLFLKRSEAEKHIDLKTNDEIQIIGTVFSDALGDAWIEVSRVTLIKKAPDKDGVK